MEMAMTGAKQEPQMKSLPAIEVAGLRMNHTIDDHMFVAIGKQWEEFSPMIETVPNKKGHSDFGLCFDMTGGHTSFDYMAGVEVSTLDGVKQPLAGIRLRPKTCAVFAHNDHVSRLNETVAKAWQWLRASGRELDANASEPTFIEHNGENFDPQTGFGDIEIWFSVKV